MQLAGGLEYLVYIAEKILYKNPKYINYLAPLVTYVLTIFAGTGHTAFSMIPVIVEVAEGEHIKPSVPLAVLLSLPRSLLQLLRFLLPSFTCPAFWNRSAGAIRHCSEFGCLLHSLAAWFTAFIVTKIRNMDLDSDPIYQKRLAEGLVKPPVGMHEIKITPAAKRSVYIFLIGVVCLCSLCFCHFPGCRTY